jgi:hypothetical protein
MNVDEIVKELREACTDNEYAPPMASNKMLTQAADLIESLQAQLVESQRRHKAAVEDLKKAMPHWCCKNKSKEYCPVSAVTGVVDCAYCGDWEWRGPQEGLR